MEESQKEIFNINLNAEGIAWILKFCRIVKIIFLGGILTGLPVLILTIILAGKKHDYSSTLPSPIRFKFIVQPYFGMLYILLWFTQIFFYWRFSNVIKSTILNLQEQQFNRSFEQLYYNAIVTIWVIIISFFINWFDLFIQLKYPV